ncbi:hypothetical protein NOR_02582 [Metarhizium rileyi]|uniref:Uncharacterized protein n=1 Tax=Metarhizium rileyi (strain RCEF 4871) TaxID=1649241 RepID=A0A167GQF8_METRR|nr:hypothetical protein NOR_02582 [Metarhizium rileyi RCEF 4871]
MADHDATRPPGHIDSRSSILTSESQAKSRTSYERGESSRSGGGREVVLGTSPLPAYSGRGEQHLGAELAQAEQSTRDALQRGGSTRRKAKRKSGGGFLLHDSISGDRRHPSRPYARDSLQPNRQRSRSPGTPPSSRSNNRQSLLPNEHSPGRLRDKSSLSPRSVESRSRASAQKNVANGESNEPFQSPQPPRTSRETTSDVDATQIVQMALNLSESRRIASRRNVSRNTPPRLGPLTDGGSGSNLRQHLQQQRRSSYNSNLKYLQGHSPKPSSGRFESNFEGGGHDSHYRYQFSPSTLARVQKAKDHLELMAQYRRLLDVLPPLKPGFGRTTSSPPLSPIASKSLRIRLGDNAPLGRHYNPLQYIRNRKVRARERKVIDGERQGFGDVEEVKPWVDKVVERATSFASYPEENGSILPEFPGADDSSSQVSPDSNSRTAARGRRPRVDWFIEPCDIVADAYWLEQDSHKELIEDHNWRKIYPSTTNMSPPMSHESVLDALDAIPPLSMQDDIARDAPVPSTSKVDTAKQTLHNIRAFPHRHGGQIHSHSHDRWHMKESISDFSSSENDVKIFKGKSREAKRSGATLTDTTKDLFQEQMLEMVARDVRDRGLFDTVSDQEPVAPTSDIKNPEKKLLPQSPSRFHSSSKGSLIDTSDSDRKPATERLYLDSPSRYVPGRQSLDVPDGPRKSSFDRYSSLPTSPELRPIRGITEPIFSVNPSPTWNRSGSPTRNPITKIRQIIRDNKSSETGPGPELDEHHRSSPADNTSPSQISNLLEKQQSASPRTMVSGSAPYDWAKMPRRSGSARVRGEDQGAGLRSMFRGPRIDTVIRGGVSKLGDMLWKKEGLGETPLDNDTTDESESEKARSRSRSSSTNVSQIPSKQHVEGHQSQQSQPKHFLDSMPQFHYVHDTHDTDNSKVVPGPPEPDSTNNSQQSRSELLRPPHFAPQSVSSSASPGDRPAKPGDSDMSESESRQGSAPSGAEHASDLLSPASGFSRAEDDARSLKSRHWSIADKGTPTEQTRLSRREVARLRALVLSTGIKAMEINRRAQQTRKPFGPETPASPGEVPARGRANRAWADIARMCPEAAKQDGQVAGLELYSLAGRSLSTAIQASGRRWQNSADQFTYRTCPQLQNRIGDVRSRIADHLSERSRKAADQADETIRDLALGQPLKVKVVMDIIDKMLRRRRRRLRWIRRALWLTVEWVLVGFMWYVWFIVMILRLFLGLGKGIWNGVRWLLWL